MAKRKVMASKMHSCKRWGDVMQYRNQFTREEGGTQNREKSGGSYKTIEVDSRWQSHWGIWLLIAVQLQGDQVKHEQVHPKHVQDIHGRVSLRHCDLLQIREPAGQNKIYSIENVMSHMFWSYRLETHSHKTSQGWIK